MLVLKKIAVFLFGKLMRGTSKLGNGKYLATLNQYIKPMTIVRKKNLELIFHTPNSLTFWRAESLFEKEPETIEWIDTFQDSDVLFDIGANVGIYSIYAAKKFPKLKVFSIEPTFFNYYLLNKNIYANSLMNQVTAVCIAVSDKNCLDYMHIPSIDDGGAQTNFGSNLDYNKNEFKADYVQGSLSYTLDFFIENFKPAFPNHLKIDVDGLEYEIISGASNTLRNPQLKSILIELNEHLEMDLKVRDIILSYGFTLKHKRHGEMFDSADSKYSKMYNYVFVR